MPTSNIKTEFKNGNNCRACGSPIEIDPTLPGRVRLYCNDRCKTAFHRGQRPTNEPTLEDCLECLADLSENTASYWLELRQIKKVLALYYGHRAAKEAK